MQATRIIALSVAASLLSGCATFSFAPPMVDSSKRLAVDGVCPPKAMAGTNTIGRNVMGALDLIENYRVSYDCAMHQLANGRQVFQVPSALAMAGGATAAALGAGPAVAIATGAGSATLNSANTYYAPKDKAHIVSAAYNAVVCIKQEASGITALNVSAAQKPENKNLTESLDNPTVTFKPELQYYQLVSAALENVGAILGERLSSIGSYSPDALVKEITALAEETEEAESDDTEEAAQDQAKALDGVNDSEEKAVVTGIVELAKLQPRLKLCVIQAKAG